MHTQKIEIDLELLQKYSVPGPRYTSYPTVPNFAEDFTREDFERALQNSNRDNAPV